MSEPLFAVAVHEAVAFGTGVVLVDDRPPPVDHLALDLDRARRSGVDTDVERGGVVLVARFLVELEHPNEHRGNDLGDRDAVFFDQAEVVDRVEPLHHDDGAAGDVRAHGESQWSSVVERRRREIARLLVGPEEEGEQTCDTGTGLLERCLGNGREHSLRSAGRAGTVEHVHACGAVLERGGRGVGDGVLVGVVAVDCASHREPQLDVGHLVAQLRSLVGFVRRGDEDPRPAVVDDVRHLVGGEAAAHRRVDEPGVVRAPAQHEEASVVLEAERNVVARLQSDTSEQVREAVGLLVEFGVGDDLVGVGHDDGRVIRTGRSVMSGVQGGSSGVGAREPSATPVTRGSCQTVKPPSTSRC